MTPEDRSLRGGQILPDIHAHRLEKQSALMINAELENMNISGQLYQVRFAQTIDSIKRIINAYTDVSKKTEQIRNRSQICKAAFGMKFLAQVHYFGTYDVE